MLFAVLEAPVISVSRNPCYADQTEDRRYSDHVVSFLVFNLNVVRVARLPRSSSEPSKSRAAVTTAAETHRRKPPCPAPFFCH